jgi:hypothetical protein
MNERRKHTTTRLLYCIPYYVPNEEKKKHTNSTDRETCAYLASYSPNAQKNLLPATGHVGVSRPLAHYYAAPKKAHISRKLVRPHC